MSIEMVGRLAGAAELRDEDTGAHIARIGFYSNKIAEAMGLSVELIEAITFSGRLHDIGKIGISDSILLKPGPLTREEFETIKTHTTIGERILSGSAYPRHQTGGFNCAKSSRTVGRGAAIHGA